MHVQNAQDEVIRVLAEQYRVNMKMLMDEGKFDHESLGQQLYFAVSSVNDEIKRITENLIKEEIIEKELAPEHYSFSFKRGDELVNIKMDRIQFEAEYAPLEGYCYSFFSTDSCEAF